MATPSPLPQWLRFDEPERPPFSRGLSKFEAAAWVGAEAARLAAGGASAVVLPPPKDYVDSLGRLGPVPIAVAHLDAGAMGDMVVLRSGDVRVPVAQLERPVFRYHTPW